MALSVKKWRPQDAHVIYITLMTENKHRKHEKIVVGMYDIAIRSDGTK